MSNIYEVDFITPIKANLENGKPEKAADLAIKFYVVANFDKSILE